MANGQAVEAERPTMRVALVEPRSPLEALGPLRVSSKFSSPLWQASSRQNAPSDAETPIDDIAVPGKGLSPVPSPRLERAADEVVPDGCLEAAAGDWFDEGVQPSGYVDQESGLDVDHDAGPGADDTGSGVVLDAPTETFPGVLVAEESEDGPSSTTGPSGGTADSTPRPFPWPPSPWPRNATAPTVRIRLADLLSGAGEDVNRSSDEVADPSHETAGPAASTAPVKLSHSVNARTVVFTAVASLVVLCAGALFVGPMGAVKIAPEGGSTAVAAGAPRVSGAPVVPAALLARSPAAAYPASIERLDAPKPAPAAQPSVPAASAALKGIPGMMGTPVPLSTPGRAGTHSNAAPATALSTAARSSDSDGPVHSVPARGDLARDHSWGGDDHFDDATRAQDSSPASGLVDGLVGGVLN